MSSLMTLREALALIDDVRADRSYCAAAGKHFAPPADLARARAIVDAAVEAHVKRCAWVDTFPDERAEALKLRSESKSAFDKLRALERGLESEVQQ